MNSAASFGNTQQTVLTLKIFVRSHFFAASCIDCIPFASASLAVVAVLYRTEPEDWQEIPASAAPLKLTEFIIYPSITNGPESLLAHHLASFARDALTH